MTGKRQWLGRPVWVGDERGTKQKGTLWFSDETDVLIRQNGHVGLMMLPKAAEGSLWGFTGDADEDVS